MTLPAIYVRQCGDRLQVRFAFNEELNEWARSLNDSRFSGKAKGGACWEVPATPAAAFFLRRTAPSELKASAGFLQLAVTFADNSLGGIKRRRDQWGELEQPANRVHDSWRHQLAAYHFGRANGWVCMLAMGMGTGKSKVLVDCVNNEPIRTAIILCPPSVLGVWRREFALFSTDRRHELLILDDSFASVKKKLDRARSFIDAARSFSDRRAFVVAINYESARQDKFAEWALRQQWDLAALDESHRAKDPAGVTGKFVAKLRFVSTRRVCLTGTPMPHSPADVFSQYQFIDSSIFGRSFFKFKKRFAREGFFGEIVGWENVPELRALFHSRAFIVGDEVLDLPEVQHIERSFPLPRAARKAYDDFWAELVAEVGQGTVTADNALVKLVRAQQMTSGFVPVEPAIDPFSDEPQSVEPKIEVLHDEKAELLRELLKDVPNDDCIVVFCRWRYDLDRVRSVVESLEWERNAVKAGNDKKRAAMIEAGTWRPFVYGELSGRAKQLDENAKIPPGIQVFGVQVQSGGVGVDFTRAAIAVLYSIDFSLGNYEQMLKRLHRPGQDRPVRFYHLVAERSVDQRIYKALAARKSVVGSIMEELSNGQGD